MKSRSSREKRPADRARLPRWPAALAADVVADSVVWEVSQFLRAKLPRERPDLLQCLPAAFSIGRPLPDGRHPRAIRRGGPVAPKARRWNAARVLADPRWREILAA
jgi:hypothetical protein